MNKYDICSTSCFYFISYWWDILFLIIRISSCQFLGLFTKMHKSNTYKLVICDYLRVLREGFWYRSMIEPTKNRLILTQSHIYCFKLFRSWLQIHMLIVMAFVFFTFFNNRINLISIIISLFKHKLHIT